MNLSNRFFATRIFRPDDFFRIVHLGVQLGVPMAVAQPFPGALISHPTAA